MAFFHAVVLTISLGLIHVAWGGDCMFSKMDYLVLSLSIEYTDAMHDCSQEVPNAANEKHKFGICTLDKLKIVKGSDGDAWKATEADLKSLYPHLPAAAIKLVMEVCADHAKAKAYFSTEPNFVSCTMKKINELAPDNTC